MYLVVLRENVRRKHLCQIICWKSWSRLAVSGMTEGFFYMFVCFSSIYKAFIRQLLKNFCSFSYFYEDHRGLFPEVQYLFDLEVPIDFTPLNADGEVESFQRLNVNQVIFWQYAVRGIIWIIVHQFNRWSKQYILSFFPD